MIKLKQDEMPDDVATVALMQLQIQGLPAEKIQAMKEFAQKLRKNNPRMKPHRLQRKVCEQFHIKLV